MLRAGTIGPGASAIGALHKMLSLTSGSITFTVHYYELKITSFSLF